MQKTRSKKSKGEDNSTEGPRQYLESELKQMNLTELIHHFSWTFGHDLPRYTRRSDIIHALATGEDIPEDGMDVLREKVVTIIQYYRNWIAPQLDCDMMCVNCPAAVVADCYKGFEDNYPVETQKALDKNTDTEP